MKNLKYVYDNTSLNEEGRMYKTRGEEFLRKGKLAVLILAGGQGTRLGTEDPKGTFVLPGVRTSLFQIHSSSVLEAQNTYNTTIPLLILTSSFTHKKTLEHFENNNYFGLRKDVVFLFQQEERQCKDMNNNLLSLNGKYCTAPNGNGGMFSALKKHGILEILDNLKIEIVNTISVDNVLARICDPVAVGCMISNNYEIVNKSVTKKENESTGVFVFDKENVKIVEYSEMAESKELSQKDNPDANQANICNHLFTLSFLHYMADKPLPIHKAYKKIPFSDSNNKVIKPKDKNGYKEELFIFDAFDFSKRCCVINVPRCLEFSPLKNNSDVPVDNPDTCSSDLIRRNEIYKKI